MAAAKLLLALRRVSSRDLRVWRGFRRIGSRPRAPPDSRYEWAYLFDAACPDRHFAEFRDNALRFDLLRRKCP